VFLLSLDNYVPDRALRLAMAERGRPAHADLPRWVKTTAQYVLGRIEVARARRAGFDDVLFRNEAGNLTESTRASFLLVEGDRLRAPPVSEGVLPGITREVLRVAAAAELGLRWDERPLHATDVETADCAALCSSSLGVVGVSQAGERVFESLEPAAALARAYERACRGEIPELADEVLQLPLEGVEAGARP
jgi:branched-chain amino acid aminotransferase